ncbi:MAG: hypothetical protein ABGZ35_05420 [Planctomycetaceae bacterium]
MSHESPESMNPNALPIDVAARMLSKAGARQITETMIRNDVDAGAPTNPDGTLNLVHYAAWNVRQMAGGGDGD